MLMWHMNVYYLIVHAPHTQSSVNRYVVCEAEVPKSQCKSSRMSFCTVSMPAKWTRMETGSWPLETLSRSIWDCKHSSTTTPKLYNCWLLWPTPPRTGLCHEPPKHYTVLFFKRWLIKHLLLLPHKDKIDNLCTNDTQTIRTHVFRVVWMLAL